MTERVCGPGGPQHERGYSYIRVWLELSTQTVECGNLASPWALCPDIRGMWEGGEREDGLTSQVPGVLYQERISGTANPLNAVKKGALPPNQKRKKNHPLHSRSPGYSTAHNKGHQKTFLCTSPPFTF